MKAVVQTYRTGQLSLIDAPAPELRPGGVLVRTECSVVSAGTERAVIELGRKSLLGKARAKPEAVRQVLKSLRENGVMETWHKVDARLNQYSPLGYSSAGTVLAVGEKVTGIRPGDRVACAGAGFANHAEIAFVPKNLCAVLPAGVSSEAGAFATIGAIALQGIRQAEPSVGERVLVVGLGMLGLLAVQMLKACGCRVAGVDLDAARAALAAELGAHAAFARNEPGVETSLQGFAPQGFDSVLLTAAASSSEPLELAAHLARDRARVVVVGNMPIQVPRGAFYEKELELRLSRSYGPGRYDPAYEQEGNDYPYGYVRWTEQRNIEAFVGMLASDQVRVNKLITHRFPIEQAEAAYRVLNGEDRQPFLAIVLEYRGAERPEASSQATTAKRSAPGTVNGGVIGGGNFARGTLVPLLRKHASVVAVASESGISAVSLANEIGARGVSVDDLLQDPGIDLIVVATRHDSHAPLVMRAMEAGKAVFVEKPLAIDSDQLSALVASYNGLAQRGPAPFVTVGFNRRFSPHSARLRQALANRTEPVTAIYRVNAGYIPAENWLQRDAGGGRIVGEACHFVDLIEYVCGAVVTEVTARATSNAGKYSNDNVSAILRLSDGSIATLLYTAAGDKSSGKERLEAFCAQTSIALDDFRETSVTRGGRTERFRTRSVEKGHAEEMRAVADAVRTGGESPIPFTDAVRVTRTTFAIEQALCGIEDR